MVEATGTYTVLARRYRPQTFDAVVGQQHVAQALRNAIRAERVAHAYLFTGARGVGKTSMARILAKALNCTNSQDGNPCNQCELCQAISTGSDVDVMEIDGASNRGIDDIRSLRANVGIRSMRTRVKMYIIDEVHMLTKEAFNALLKTLEEPPPNVKFVFCTTEPHKVPDTILSRCQRFDFSSIETQKISERLAEIAASEGIEVAPEAVDLVARRAGGSMRDSQSLFDQLLAFGGARIEAADVNQLLGTAGDQRLLNLIESAHSGEQADLLAEVDQASREGVQLGNLLDQLVNCYRDMMVLSCGADSLELIGVGPGAKESLQQIGQRIGLQTVMAAMQILSEAKSKLSRVSHGRALVDLALIRISMLENLDDLTQLIGDLKSGQMPNLTVAAGPAGNPPPRSAAPAQSPAQPRMSSAPPQQQAAPAAPPAPQKKTPEVAPPEPVYQEEEPQPVTQIEFSEANRERLWKQLLGMLETGIVTHLSKVLRTAISAPNRLDVFFQSTYAFSKSYFEDKPDLIRKIESQLQQLTGQSIVVRFHLDATQAPEQETAAAATEAARVSVSRGAAKPAFVESAEEIFSATVARADRIRKAGEG